MTANTRTVTDRVGALLVSGRLGVVDSGTRTATAKVLASDGSGAVYTTRVHIDGWTSCTCDAARYRPRQRCVHVCALLKVAAWSLRAAVSSRRGTPAGKKEEENA